MNISEEETYTRALEREQAMEDRRDPRNAVRRASIDMAKRSESKMRMYDRIVNWAMGIIVVTLCVMCYFGVLDVTS